MASMSVVQRKEYHASYDIAPVLRNIFGVVIVLHYLSPSLSLSFYLSTALVLYFLLIFRKYTLVALNCTRILQVVSVSCFALAIVLLMEMCSKCV